MRYRNDIDGLRAIAVLAVVLFHAKIAFPGGFVGVDVFFVISGYLITSLIRADLERGTFSLSRFWDRRIRRIWPASLVVVLVTLCLGWLIMCPEDLRGLANDAIAQVFMLANVRFYLKTDYFGEFAEINPLLHMWSLALEEQFYVFFPILMAWCWRWSRSCCWIVLAAIAVVSFVASWAVLGQHGRILVASVDGDLQCHKYCVRVQTRQNKQSKMVTSSTLFETPKAACICIPPGLLFNIIPVHIRSP